MPETLTGDSAQLAVALARLLPGREQAVLREQIADAVAAATESAHGRLDRRQLDHVIANIPVAIAYVDVEMRIVFANPAYVVRIGKTADEVIGRPVREVLGPENFARIEPYLRQALTGERLMYEVHVDYAAGPRDVCVTYEPHFDADDQLRGVTATIEDITDRKRLEERFRAFAENSAEGLWFADARTMTLEYLSPAFDRLWGVPRHEMLGSFTRWFDLIAPEHRALAREHLQQLLAGNSHSAEHRMIRQNDLAARWLRDSGFPIFDAQGAVTRIAGITRDITEEKDAAERLAASEERLRLIVENAREFAIFTTDDARRITSWNSGAEHVLGYREAEIVGRKADILFTDQDRAARAPENEIEAALEEGRAVDDRWHVRKDGKMIWSSGYLMPIHDSSKAVVGFVKILHDRTAAKAAEEALQKARAQEFAELARTELLQKLSAAQEEERSRVARELHDGAGQTLAALLLMLGEMASTSRLESRAAIHEARRLAESIGRDLHRLASRLRPTSLDDLGLIAALRAAFEMWSTRTRVEVDFHTTGFESRLPPEVETALYRIVDECLTNVEKHARARRVAVILQRRTDDVTAIIEDDGAGFDLEAARVPARKTLGLDSMNERAALLGGDVRIESRAGQGTTVIVRFPVQRRADVTE